MMLSALLGCSSDGAVKAAAASDGLRILADSVLSIGDTLHFRAEVIDATGAVVAQPSVVAVPTDSSVLVRFLNTGVFIGMKGGITSVSFAAAGHDTPVVKQVRVRDDRAVVALALGQTVTGRIMRNFSPSRYALSLVAGDTIDFMLEPGAGTGLVTLRSLDASLPVTATIGGTYGARQIYAAIVAPAAGTYSFDVLGIPYPCTRGVCLDANADFTLKVRRSGPVLNVVNTQRGLPPIPAGGSAVDSIVVQNVGARTMNVVAEATDPRVSIVAQAAPVKGPTKVLPDGTIPDGSATIAVRISSNDAPGTPTGGGSVRLLLDSTTWSLLSGSVAIKNYPVNTYDPTVRLISRQYFDDIAVPVAGPIYAVAGTRAYAIDRATGATTIVRDGARNFQEVWSSGDGKVYLHYNLAFEADTISRLNADGSLTPVFGFTDRNLAVMTVRDDNTMYVAQNGTLRSRSSEGVVTAIGTGISPENGGMVYSAADNALYYVTASTLRRFDLASLAESTRGTVPSSLRLSAVDKVGRLIGFTFANGFVLFYGTDGTLLRTLVPPATATAVAVRGDTLYGAGPPSSSTNFLWKAPVP